MKLSTRLILIACCACWVQGALPAKQPVKAYKTNLFNDTWTVAILNPCNPTQPISIRSFKSTTNMLPGRNLFFNFDENTTNIIQVYPTQGEHALEYLAKDTECGQVKTLSVTQKQTPPGSTIKIEVIHEKEYLIAVEPPPETTRKIVVYTTQCGCESMPLIIKSVKTNTTTPTDDQLYGKPITIRTNNFKRTHRLSIPAHKDFYIVAQYGKHILPAQQIYAFQITPDAEICIDNSTVLVTQKRQRT